MKYVNGTNKMQLQVTHYKYINSPFNDQCTSENKDKWICHFKIRDDQLVSTAPNVTQTKRIHFPSLEIMLL